MSFWPAFLLGAAFFLRAGPSLAGPVFVWVDQAGALHATDRLGDVPEPYYGLYAARLADMKRRGLDPEAPAPPDPLPAASRPPPSPQAPSATDDVIAQRRHWHGLVARWRAELALATAEVQRLQAAVDAVKQNPLLRLTPGNQAEMAQLLPPLAAAAGRVQQARQMLLQGIPRLAQQSHVPPAWLQ